MNNRLIHEASPYLQQHAHNPVDWFPWGDEAFAKALAENKPVFLSIGYSTCHWCHVMERESFESAEMAGVLNAHFVAIKVDREERPDIDRLYMTAVQAVTGRGGWPMSVWLTPDRQPFYCGTYFPPDTFRELLERIHDVWGANRDGVLAQAGKLTAALAEHLTGGTAVTGLDDAPLRACFAQLREVYDAEHGGFGGAPKFPHPVTLNFLFRYFARTGEMAARDMALHQLRAMGEGGLHDQLGGGFHRYSVDERWLVSHFEKMLYDQALLIGSYVDAWQITGEPFYAEIARRTAEYVLRDLTSPAGAFYAAEDADSEGEEGKFYVWTRAELAAVLGDRTEEFCRAHGEQILYGPIGDEREALLAARNRRVRPHRDEKILTAWNGLMISALARLEMTVPAARAAQWILTHHVTDGRLRRTATVPGLLEDYAFFATGLLDLYEATGEPAWLAKAQELAEKMIELFGDSERGGFFQTDGRDGSVLIRSKDDYDGAEPSGNSMATLLLLRLGGERHRTVAEKTLGCFGERLRQSPHAMPQMLCALDWALAGPVEVTITGNPDAVDTRALLRVAREGYQPNRVVRWHAVAGPATAQVCRERVCQSPVSETGLLRELLGRPTLGGTRLPP